MKNDPVIRVSHLSKTYGQVVAVDDISFEVERGEIFGFLGPNGAGKTTTIECLEGLRKPDKGILRVLDLEPQKQKHALSLRMGVQLQQSVLATQMKVWEALDLFSSFYPKCLDIDLLLEKLDLIETRHTVFGGLSGGQKQRLFIALALIHDPELVFLDELTTGLDPQGRRAMWGLINEINTEGKTILLTSNFMEEAERLCGRVAIMDKGRIIALDSPENLIKSLNVESKVIFNFYGRLDLDSFKALRTVKRIEKTRERMVVMGQGDRFVADVVNFLTEKGIRYSDLRTEQPNLEDVFLRLTGKGIRD